MIMTNKTATALTALTALAAVPVLALTLTICGPAASAFPLSGPPADAISADAAAPAHAACAPSSRRQDATSEVREKAAVARYEKSLAHVFEVQDRIKDVHPFLRRTCPVAVAEDGKFLIFRPEAAARKYVFVKAVPAGMAVPRGVRAAFPLEAYDNRMVCVVTGDVFDTEPGYVTIFHEFIHCLQWETVEPKLKEKLAICREAMARKDFMWELNYPFPYGRADFAANYERFLKALDEKRSAADIRKARSEVIAILDPACLEYMTWQEWKEGFARHVENMVRARLGNKENHVGRERPFDRGSFYEGGASYIGFLEHEEPGIDTDLEALFARISGVA